MCVSSRRLPPGLLPPGRIITSITSNPPPLKHPHRLDLPKGSTLVDAVALGMGRRKLATTALLEVKRALESQPDYPVMVAVDEFSEW